MSVLFTGASPGDIADATAYSANWNLLEGSLDDIGEYVISGLVVSSGTGLSVNVTSGVASIGGRVTKATGFTIGGLTPSQINHLYLLQDGTGTSNTTGIQPVLSTKLGTATTDGAGVTAVGSNRASGRQTRRRTEDEVHGAGAGFPRALDLSSWNATNDEGNECKGVLPAGAVTAPADAVITDPATSARNLIQSTVGTAIPLTVKAQTGQSVHLIQWQNSSGALLGGIGPGGSLIYKGTAMGQRTLTTNTTLLGTDHHVFVDATAGPLTITLPLANVSTPFGISFTIKKIDNTTNAVTVQTQGGALIENAATTMVISGKLAAVSLVSDTVNWWVD